MAVVRNLIEYYGIADYLPDENVSFSQISIEDETTPSVSDIKIKEICKVYSKGNVNRFKIVDTLQGQSLDGVRLTGKKAIVAGDVNYKIEYIANNEANSVHTINHIVPYATSIVVPEYFMEEQSVDVEVFIEDVNVTQINESTIYLSSVLLLTIEQ